MPVVFEAGAGAGHVADESEEDADAEGVQTDVEPAAEVVVDSVDHGVEDGGGEDAVAGHVGKVRGALSAETDGVLVLGFGAAEPFAEDGVFD